MTTDVEREAAISASRAAVGGAPAIPGLRFRQATAADWGGLAELVNRARAADDVDEVHTAESWAAEYPESEMFQLTRDVLIAEVDGRIVAQATGYLTTRDGALVAESSGAVLPELRRRGLGTALYRATHERLAHQAADDPRPGPRERRAYALDDEVADRAMLDANGYVAIRFGFEMRRFPAGPPPPPPPPPRVELRPGTPEQAPAVF